MLSESLSNALSEQMNAEFYSAYLYLAMSAYCENKGYSGFANWLYVQYQEETAHANRIYRHILERDGEVLFEEISAPKVEYHTLLELFRAVLAHEQLISKKINDIATQALKENDHATYSFIQWFVDEQVEEESSARDILQKVERMKNNDGLLLVVDAEMKNRVFEDDEENS